MLFLHTMQVDEQAEDQGVAWTPPATCPKFRERPLPGIDTPDAVVWSVSCQGALSAEGARRVAPLPSPLSISPFPQLPSPSLGRLDVPGRTVHALFPKRLPASACVCAAEWKQVGCVL